MSLLLLTELLDLTDSWTLGGLWKCSFCVCNLVTLHFILEKSTKATKE